MRGFIGKISYLRRFIPALASIIKPLHQLTKKDTKYKWGPEHDYAFEEIKKILTNSRVMVAPSPEKELLIYLVASDESVGILIAQDYEGLEKPVYYLSRLLRGSEKNYSLADKLCVALMYAIQKLRHYMVTHRVRIITNSDPIKLLLQKPILTGR